MAFTDLFIRRPILSLIVSLVMVLIGVKAAFSLPVRQFPMMESATISIDTAYPGATQDVMQGFVTTPITQAITGANGIDYITSISSPGFSTIKAKLQLNANSDRTMTEVLAKMQQVKSRLPEGITDPVITRVTDGAMPIQYVALISDTLSQAQMTDFATRVAQPLISSVPGVASSAITGGSPFAMRVWIDPVKLAARGLTASDVGAALRANNVQAAPGRLKDERTVIDITAATDLRDVEGFEALVVKRGTRGGIVRLRDVATVELGSQNYELASTSTDKPGVSLVIFPTPEGNPLEIVAKVKALIPQLQRVAPPGMKVYSAYDATKFVNASIDEVVHTLVIAIVIVILIIFLSLGSLRTVVIPIVTIPLSLLGTAALMLAFGLSINLLTLLAMVLAIGLVVDDAIVVVENIHRHIEEGYSPFDAAIMGAREIVGPVIAMTVALAAVYVPIGLIGGLTGALFREFAFTLAGSVIVSGLVALTLSPMMCGKLLSAKAEEGRMAVAIEHTMERLAQRYEGLLDRTMRARGAVLLVGACVLVSIIVMFTGARRELAPQEDMGYVIVQDKAPQYASIDYIADFNRKVEHLLTTIPEYADSWFDAGGPDGTSSSIGGISLTPWHERERSAGDIQAELIARTAGFTQGQVAIFQAAPLPTGSGGLPVQLVVRSSASFPEIYQTMEGLKAKAWQSGLFAFVDSDLAFDSPEARIHVDREKAGALGITMGEIADALALQVGENYVNRFNWFDRSYDVIAQVPRERRMTPDDLGKFYVRTGSGQLIPLSTVLTVEMRPQPNKLPQFDQLNAATLSAVLMPGVTMGQAVAYLEAQPLPAGMSVDWLSSSRQYVTEGDRLTMAFGTALIVIFLVLAAQFESFRDSGVILVTVPLAVCGALVPIYLGYATLNIYTQIGLVTLIGLITKHGILMVAFANDLQRDSGMSRQDAIRRAASVRMRPVLMTTAAMVAGLVPLLFAGGAGAESRYAIGIVVVLGMLVGTVFTLFLLPTIYTLLASDHRIGAGLESERAVSQADEVAHA